ncbi:MAG TPA: surface-adhesin E family protein [Steroidobacteraceae bacterium]|nr:surface-adhesin E family protein [Steroidobacteraceae bacterium]
MNNRPSFFAAAATAVIAGMLSAPASAQANWEEIAASDSKEVFVNLNSLQRNGEIVSATVKENFVAPQPAKKDKTYLSAKNAYRFDCANRKVAYKSMKAYPQAELQGEPVQKAEFKDKNLIWRDAPERSMDAALLDYVCTKAPPGTAAPTSD